MHNHFIVFFSFCYMIISYFESNIISYFENWIYHWKEDVSKISDIQQFMTIFKSYEINTYIIRFNGIILNKVYSK